MELWPAILENKQEGEETAPGTERNVLSTFSLLNLILIIVPKIRNSFRHY
jgi:hypothetical protein